MGELVKFKCVDILLKAFRSVTNEIPAQLDVLSSGPERNHLEKLAVKLGLQDSVTFHGRLAGRDLVDRLGQAHVFAFPSLREAGGAAVLEAMSLGLPVVAADWGGPSEFLSPDEGILVPPDSPDAFQQGFAEAMLRLAKNERLRLSMGRAGRAKVLSTYSWDQRICTLLDLYRSLCDFSSTSSSANS